MNSDQLLYLIAISKSSSLSSASKKLHISTQALSAGIKKLENEIGFKLLNRSSKGVSLTTNGEWLVQESSIFLNKIDERKKQYLSQNKQIHKGNLHILINYSGVNDNIVGQLIGLLYEQEPNLKISLEELPKEIILEEIKSQNNEFGFIFRTKVNGNYIDELDSDLYFEPLFYGNLVLSTANNTIISKFNTITLEKATQYPLCVYNPQSNGKDSLYYLITEIFQFPIQFEVEKSFSVYKEKLKRGIASTLSLYLPTEKQPRNYIDGTKIIYLRDDIKIYFGYVQKKDLPLSCNGVFFLEKLNDLLHDFKYSEENSLFK